MGKEQASDFDSDFTLNDYKVFEHYRRFAANLISNT